MREVRIIKNDGLADIAPTRDRRDSPEAFKPRRKCQGTGISKDPRPLYFSGHSPRIQSSNRASVKSSARFLCAC